MWSQIREKLLAVILLVGLVALSIPGGASAYPAPQDTTVVSPDGWGWQNPLPQGNSLYGVWGTSASDVYAVGEGGAILHFDGVSWAPMASGTSNTLRGVWGTSWDDVWAVGDLGTIIRYNGSSWADVDFGYSEYPGAFYGVWGSSHYDIYVVGQGGVAFHYNGSWSQVLPLSNETLRAVSGTAANDVFVVGTAGGRAIFRRYDGSAWSAPQDRGTAGTSGFNGVWGSSYQEMYAVGTFNGGYPYVMHQYGLSWSCTSVGPQSTLNGVWVASVDVYADIWAVGSGGVILHGPSCIGASMDFTQVQSGTGENLNAIWGSSATDIFAVGDHGTILHYESAGNNWTSMSTGVENNITDVWSSSPTDAWAVGRGGVILHCDRSTWEWVESPTSADLWGVWGSGASNVWAVGTGVILHYDGLSWTSQSVSETFYDISGSAWNDVWAVGHDSAVWHNNGSGWGVFSALPSTDYDRRLMGVWANSPDNVWIVGTECAGFMCAGTSFHWDGSAWWECPVVKDTGSGEVEWLATGLADVWESPAGDVYAVGVYDLGGQSGCVLRWDYEGSTWVSDEIGLGGALYGVWGTSPSDVYAVGDRGTILHRDSSSWTSMNSGTESDLRGVWGSSDSDVLAVGEKGTILHHGLLDWFECSDGPRESVNAVWRDVGASEEAFAVGDGGLILHYDGTGWTQMDSGTGCDLNDVCGWNATDVWAVGDGGTVLHYDGYSWGWGAWPNAPQFNGVSVKTIYYGAYGTPTPVVYVVGAYGTGSGIILRGFQDEWDDISQDVPWSFGAYQDVYADAYGLYLAGYDGGGHGFVIMHDESPFGWDGQWSYSGGPSSSWAPLNAVWETLEGEVYVVGQNGTIRRLPPDGSWETMVSGTQSDLHGITSCVFGVFPNYWSELWAVGDHGTILHYDGQSWSPMDSGTGKNLRSVASKQASEDIFAVGAGGTILHYPSPTISSLNLHSGIQGQSYTATIYGARLVGATAVSFGPGIDVTNFSTGVWPFSDWVSVDFTIQSGAAPGPRTVSVTTPDGTATLANAFVVGPRVTWVSVNKGGRGQTLDVVVKGTNLPASHTVSFGSGITVTEPLQLHNTTSIRVRLYIATSAAIGPRAISVTTPYGTSTLHDSFTVTQEPIITSVSPSTGGPGQTLNVTIAGASFYRPIAVSFGQGITVTEPLQQPRLDTWNVKLRIDSTATLGTRAVKINTPYGQYTLANAFTVTNDVTPWAVVSQQWAARTSASSLPQAMAMSGSTDGVYATQAMTSATSANVDDFAGAMALDGSGNVYVTGMSEGNLIMGPGLEGGDYRTTKYLSTDNYPGVVSWSKTYNGCLVNDDVGGVDWAQAMAVDSSGNVYVTGGSEGEGANGMDYATIKYNSSGVQQWVARYNGPASGDDVALAIAVDSSGNVYVTGQSLGTDQGYDYATVKYNSSGVAQWVARYDRYNGPTETYDSDVATAIAVDGQGNVYVTGRSLGALIYIDYADYATVKYDANGVQRWVATYDGAGGSDIAEAIALDGQGNVYVCGSSDGATDEWDYAVVKYRDNGNTADQVWVACYDGPISGMDSANDMAIDASGNIYVTGYSQAEETGFDYASVKFEDHGTYAAEAWVARYDGPASGDDWASALAVDSSGNVYVTGESPNGVSSDYATVKYNTSGIEQWVARYDGPAGGLDSATDIVVDGRGNVFVTGTSAGGSTGWDWATVMYSQGVKTYTWLGSSPIIRFPSVTLQFEEVTTAGDSEVITSPTGPTLPSSYESGNPSTYFEISTTAEYTGPVEVSLSYAGMTFDKPETELVLLHQTETGWEEIPASIDTGQKLISGMTTSFSTFVIVARNEAPVVGDINAPLAPLPMGSTVLASASFANPDPCDYGLHTAVWDWGDGTTSPGTLTESNGSGTVSDHHTYTAAGIYTVTLTVADSLGAQGESVFLYVVIYDPSAGFVTGGGWIDSPAGAYTADPSLMGKATFGFVAKYQKGANVPTGQTQFQFHLGGLDFKSTSYQWLLISGARAQFKGYGTVNGEGNYGFLLTAIDGQVKNGGGFDKFRIKIWDVGTGAVIYDNQMDAGDTSDTATVLSGGSIVIRK